MIPWGGSASLQHHLLRPQRMDLASPDQAVCVWTSFMSSSLDSGNLAPPAHTVHSAQGQHPPSIFGGCLDLDEGMKERTSSLWSAVSPPTSLPHSRWVVLHPGSLHCWAEGPRVQGLAPVLFRRSQSLQRQEMQRGTRPTRTVPRGPWGQSGAGGSPARH